MDLSIHLDPKCSDQRGAAPTALLLSVEPTLFRRINTNNGTEHSCLAGRSRLDDDLQLATVVKTVPAQSKRARGAKSKAKVHMCDGESSDDDLPLAMAMMKRVRGKNRHTGVCCTCLR